MEHKNGLGPFRFLSDHSVVQLSSFIAKLPYLFHWTRAGKEDKNLLFFFKKSFAFIYCTFNFNCLVILCSNFDKLIIAEQFKN